jgi:hypothetical protein
MKELPLGLIDYLSGPGLQKEVVIECASGMTEVMLDVIEHHHFDTQLLWTSDGDKANYYCERQGDTNLIFLRGPSAMVRFLAMYEEVINIQPADNFNGKFIEGGVWLYPHDTVLSLLAAGATVIVRDLFYLRKAPSPHILTGVVGMPCSNLYNFDEDGLRSALNDIGLWVTYGTQGEVSAVGDTASASA